METVDGSRRALVAGGTMMAATLATGWWLHGGAGAPGRDGAVTVVPGTGVPGVAAATQPGAMAAAGALAALVGQAVRIGGEFGPAAATIVEATVLPTGGARPADIRALTYQLTFVIDRAGAPRGEAVYPLATAIDGMDRLFLSRGADRGDRATLIAVVG